MPYSLIFAREDSDNANIVEMDSIVDGTLLAVDDGAIILADGAVL